MIGRVTAAAAAGVAAAFGSALCCAGPLIAVTLSLSGAGLATAFEPLRPYFLAGSGLLLVAGHVGVRRQKIGECDDGTPCAAPGGRRRMKSILWVATALALVFATYPTWSGWVL